MNTALLKKFKTTPQLAIITGSGIELFKNHKPLFSIKYSKLPFFSEATRLRNGVSAYRRTGEKIKGHEGKLKLYKIKNKNVVVFSGRRHLYEGLDITDVIANIRLSHKLGIKKILTTNAAGGLSKGVRPYALTAGDLMLITSFINLMQPTERGVLSAIVEPAKKINTKLTKLISNKFKGEIKTGTYAANIGPSYETYSEIKLLQLLGASAIGMSTIPELICAKSLGIDFAGISIISNVWDKKHKPSHKEVLKNVSKANNKLNDLILRLIDLL